MRISLGLVVVGSVALVACSGDDGAGSIRRGNPGGLLGSAIFGADSVFVRSLPASATDPLKNGIHAIKGTEDRVVACGRDTITAFAADSTSVVWAEQGKGVFRAPR